jgi:pimeloyl-ACP methyl ester carboxylesterase
LATETLQISEKYAQLTHGKTRYFEAGSGYPTILLHGAGFVGAADGWLHLFPALAQKLRVISIDSLNWGPGDVFDQEFSFGYLVDHVREFMDALDIEKANIAGHSMGGWLAGLLAYESPDRVNKVVLSSAGGSETRPLQSMVDWKPPAEEQVRTQVTRRMANFPPGVDGEKILQDYLNVIADPVHTDAFAKVMRHMTNNDTRVRYNTRRRLVKVKVPALILWGTADQTNDISMGHDIHSLIEGSKMVTFEGAGHGTTSERAEDWAREVLAFLTS